MLQGVHHPRINYPEKDPVKQVAAVETNPQAMAAPSIQKEANEANAVKQELRPITNAGTDAGAPVGVMNITPIDEMA